MKMRKKRILPNIKRTKQITGIPSMGHDTSDPPKQIQKVSDDAIQPIFFNLIFLVNIENYINILEG